MKNVFEIRTDLALEVNEQVNREKGRLKGVIINEMKDNKTGIKVTVLEITGKEGVKALHRPEGKYITIEAGKLGTTDDEYSQRTAVILAKNLEELLSGYIREKEKATVLVLGLGNADVTADALGPDVVKNIEKNELSASISALQNPMICQKVLFDEIQKKFNEDEELKDIDFEVSYNETIEKNDPKLFASMWVTIYGENDERYEIYGNVTFICTESEIQVSAPEIKHKLKHSLVVAVEPTYEYACVTSGTAISAITEDQWVQGNESDDFGCYEMSGLAENTDYVVYKRIIGVDEYYGSSTATTGGEETICLAEADENAKNVNVGNVKAGDRISIPLKGLKVACYGKPKDGFKHGDFDFRCDNEMNKLLWDGYWSLNSYDKDNNLLVTFTVPEQLESGKVYTVKICYNFECSKESDNPDEWGDLITKSDDLIYTVTFTVE